MLKLVEQSSGMGNLIVNGEVLHPVRYTILRYQGMAESGLPIPGVHRIEGSLDFDVPDKDGLVGVPLTLKLEDGRALGITLAASDGRIFSEGHGPGRCLCC